MKANNDEYERSESVCTSNASTQREERLETDYGKNKVSGRTK